MRKTCLTVFPYLLLVFWLYFTSSSSSVTFSLHLRTLLPSLISSKSMHSPSQISTFWYWTGQTSKWMVMKLRLWVKSPTLERQPCFDLLYLMPFHMSYYLKTGLGAFTKFKNTSLYHSCIYRSRSLQWASFEETESLCIPRILGLMPQTPLCLAKPMVSFSEWCFQSIK